MFILTFTLKVEKEKRLEDFLLVTIRFVLVMSFPILTHCVPTLRSLEFFPSLLSMHAHVYVSVLLCKYAFTKIRVDLDSGCADIVAVCSKYCALYFCTCLCHAPFSL